jgi:hypothetical protein
MTLAEVLPSARLLSATEKLKLIRILAEDLDMTEDISPLEPFKTYDLPTPVVCGKIAEPLFNWQVILATNQQFPFWRSLKLENFTH